MYVNVGAQRIDGSAFPTIKSLREALAADPASVRFFCTSPLGPQFSGNGTEIPSDLILSVCGPDPFRKRDWHVSVSVKNGALKVTA